MADVSVEFGAKDVGLQDSLKKIQGEMQSLEGKVKKGGLSFEELEGTMKRLGQVERLEKQLQAIGNESAGTGNKVGELGKDIQSTGNKSEKMGEQSGMGFAKLAAAVGVGQLAAKAFTAVLDSAFAAVTKTIQGFTQALDLGGRLSDLSASTGETAGKLLILERAFDNSGIGAEKVGSTIARMQKNIEDARDGSGTAARAFAAMGVTVDELEGKLPTEQLKILSSGINSIEDPTKRAAAAMGVFGKSGAELIPLLTNMEGELAEARDTVGSMAEIMDRRAATFDAVSDRFKAISEKVRDFAAGILDRALPAIDAITVALSRIDAAKIGQNLADAFLGGEKAMGGFQAAVDAFKTGQISAAFQIFWDSTKLQAAQTANEIYKRLIASLQSAGQFLVKVLGPGSGAFSVVADAFGVLGLRSFKAFASAFVELLPSLNKSLLGPLEAAAAIMPGIFGPAMIGFKAAAAGTELLKSGLDGIEEKIVQQNASLEQNVKNFGENAKKSFAEIPKSFEENYATIPPLFENLEELQASIAQQEKNIAANVATTNAEREKTNEKLEEEKNRRAQIAAEAEAAEAKQKSNRIALVELETALNLAKASGNEELVKSLEGEKKRLENEKEIAKLTKEYLPLVGNNAKEAERLATNMVNAKNAAAGIGNRDAIITITTKVDDTRWKDLLAELAVNSDPKAIAVALEVTGQKELTDALSTLQNMETISKNHQVAMDVIGAKSLEEVRANLNAVATPAQAQLAMQITGEDDLKTAIRKLDTFKGTRTAKALLEKQGFENIDQLKDALKGIIGDKRTKLIVDALGVKDAQAAKDALDAILNNNGKKATITAEADTTPAQEKIAELSTKTTTVPLDGDTNPLQETLSAFSSSAVKLTLDAADSIAAIRTALAEPITMNLQGSGSGSGTGGDSALTGLVSDIKGLMTTLTQRLPSPVLT
jgi:hypothetical protein